MEATKPTTERFTFADYLRLEELSGPRNEFYYGQIIPLPPSTLKHNLITQNFARALHQAAKPMGYQMFSLGVRVMLVEQQHCTYPDVMAVCDPADELDEYFVRRPEIVVSVLPSNAESAPDPAILFQHYQRLPSLQHYLRVSQKVWAAEYFRRNNLGQWVLTVFTEQDDVLKIAALGLRLPLTELYDDTRVVPLCISPVAAQH